MEGATSAPLAARTAGAHDGKRPIEGGITDLADGHDLVIRIAMIDGGRDFRHGPKQADSPARLSLAGQTTGI